MVMNPMANIPDYKLKIFIDELIANFNQEPNFDIVDDELAFPEWPDDGEEPIEESLWAGQLANALQARRKAAKKNSQKAWKHPPPEKLRQKPGKNLPPEKRHFAANLMLELIKV
jgi:hypothetical protein